MRTEIKRTSDSKSWNLYVNGYIAVPYETYNVCSKVEEALRKPYALSRGGRWFAAEVANVIRRTLKP